MDDKALRAQEIEMEEQIKKVRKENQEFLEQCRGWLEDSKERVKELAVEEALASQKQLDLYKQLHEQKEKMLKNVDAVKRYERYATASDEEIIKSYNLEEISNG